MSQLNFSKEANESLKNDYDLLQDKFQAYMKSNNSINQDLKDEIADLAKKNLSLKTSLENLNEQIETKYEEAKMTIDDAKAEFKK